MCIFGGNSGPSAPEPIKPPQEVKAPDTVKVVADARRARTGSGMGAGSTLLTGPSGSAPAAGQLGKATLLGQ